MNITVLLVETAYLLTRQIAQYRRREKMGERLTSFSAQKKINNLSITKKVVFTLLKENDIELILLYFLLL